MSLARGWWRQTGGKLLMLGLSLHSPMALAATPMPPSQVLSRLALTLTGRSPNAQELAAFKAAAAGSEATFWQAFTGRIDEMLKDPGFKAQVEAYHGAWWHLPLGDSTKLAAELVAGNRPYSELFKKDYVYVSGATADSYAAAHIAVATPLPETTSGYQYVRLADDEPRYHSILSNPDFLAAFPDTPTNHNRKRSELIESELFGHVKGAFTGAHGARRGFFEAAHGGTLFLDEVGDLSLPAQAKILRALQNGEITPVGSNVTLTVDVRVIAATNRNLKHAVEAGLFREDLYYRLAVVTVESPPLRERPEDISLLAEYFVRVISLENGLVPRLLSPAMTEALQSSAAHYPWPGNIRELRNVIERLMILGGPDFSPLDLPPEIRPRQRQGATVLPPLQAKVVPWEQFKQQSERAYLIAALKTAEGNVSEAARWLEVERTTIHKWLKAMHIDRSEYLATCGSASPEP